MATTIAFSSPDLPSFTFFRSFFGRPCLLLNALLCRVSTASEGLNVPAATRRLASNFATTVFYSSIFFEFCHLRFLLAGFLSNFTQTQLSHTPSLPFFVVFLSLSIPLPPDFLLVLPGIGGEGASEVSSTPSFLPFITFPLFSPHC